MIKNKLFLTFILVLNGCLINAQQISFYSQEFETGLRQYLNIDNSVVISDETTDTITSLNLSGFGIRDIRDIILLPNVISLDLSHNLISDISDLINLSNLQELNISDNILQNIDILIFTEAKEMYINTSFNYINDFSMLLKDTDCKFILTGTDMQKVIENERLIIGQLYSFYDNSGQVKIIYSADAVGESPLLLNIADISIGAIADKFSHEYLLTKQTNSVQEVTLTMNNKGDTTYIVPLHRKNVSKGGSITIPLGLPEDYDVRIYHNTFKESVELQGNNIVYTATNSFNGDTIYYEFKKEGQIKGYSHIYLQEGTTGIDEINADPVIYPNPATTFAILKNAEGKLVSIYNAMGSKIFEKQMLNEENIIDISAWSSGTYFVQISNGGIICNTLKLIKK
jgi:Leucine-rich repeat (LRR) protein